jgi:hypothetical protein
VKKKDPSAEIELTWRRSVSILVGRPALVAVEAVVDGRFRRR